jgi:hypothetical protein
MMTVGDCVLLPKSMFYKLIKNYADSNSSI